VTAAAVNLSSPGTTGSFGTAANPLLTQASALRATVTGTGSVNVANVPAGGSLTVTTATTNNGAINISTAAGGLSVTGAINAGNAPITLTAGGTDSTFSNTATITNGGTNPITISADRMNLQAVITNTSTGRVTLQATSAGRLIDLGSTTDVAANTLELSDNELNQIQTNGVLQVGNA